MRRLDVRVVAPQRGVAIEQALRPPVDVRLVAAARRSPARSAAEREMRSRALMVANPPPRSPSRWSAARSARTLSSRRRWRGSPLNVAPRKAQAHSNAELDPDDPRAERQDVHVVVLDALVRRVRVVADGGAHAADLVRGDARAHAGAADQDAALRLAVGTALPRRCAKSG